MAGGGRWHATWRCRPRGPSAGEPFESTIHTHTTMYRIRQAQKMNSTRAASSFVLSVDASSSAGAAAAEGMQR